MRWSGTASTTVDLRSGVLDRLTQAVSFDGAFFATVDPATLLYTSGVRRDLPPDASPAFVRAELSFDDLNQLRTLAFAPSAVGWLDEATAGNRATSRRYREAMQPIGLGDELRVALRIDGSCWGLLCLHRAAAATGFERRDAALLARVMPHVAEALRRTTVLAATSDGIDGEGPGVAVIAPDLTVESTTAAGAHWLSQLAELDVPYRLPLPTAVLAVLAKLHAVDMAPNDEAPPRARVRAPSGRWLRLHASHLDGGAENRTAVVIEPAAPAEVTPMVVAAYALTPRETEVVQRLLVGLARKQIADELQITANTVNDHVKAIFDKTGVSSAGQLRHQLFVAHYGPR